MLLYRTRILCQREKHRSQKSTLRSHFASREGKESGGPKGYLDHGLGICVWKAWQSNREYERLEQR
jgi:hypothetical protein